MQVYSNAASLITTVRLLDDNGDPITAVAFDDADLEVAYRLQGGTAWTVVTLVDGTVGTFLANSWKADPDGDGLYQFCPPNAIVVAGTVTHLRVTHGANAPQYDTIAAVLVDPDVIDSIQEKTALLTAGRRPQVVSPVSAGGHITLHRDTDYLVASDSALEIPVDDVGGALAARLESATLANLRFGAGRPNQGEEISGTVQSVTYSAGTETTTIVVEIERATLESAIVSDGYTYQIRRTDASDRLVREVIGRLTIEENHVD